METFSPLVKSNSNISRPRSWSLLESTKKIPKLKIAIVGDCGVGKTTFIQTLIQHSDNWNPNSLSPRNSLNENISNSIIDSSEKYKEEKSYIETKFNENLNNKESKEEKRTSFILTNSFEDEQNHEYQILLKSEIHSLLWVHIWDTAGEEKFRSLTSTYYRGCDLIVVMFDVSDAETMDDIKFWLSDIERYAPANIPVLVFANKIDLLKNDSLKNISLQLATSKYPDLDIRECQSNNWESSFPLLIQLADIAYDSVLKKAKLRNQKGPKFTNFNGKNKSPIPSPKILLKHFKSNSENYSYKKTC